MALNMKQSKAFLGNCSAFQVRPAARGRARQAIAPRAERSGVWLPGVESPAWLDGSLPADRGRGAVAGLQQRVECSFSVIQ